MEPHIVQRNGRAAGAVGLGERGTVSLPSTLDPKLGFRGLGFKQLKDFLEQGLS